MYYTLLYIFKYSVFDYFKLSRMKAQTYYYPEEWGSQAYTTPSTRREAWSRGWTRTRTSSPPPPTTPEGTRLSPIRTTPSGTMRSGGTIRTARLVCCCLHIGITTRVREDSSRGIPLGMRVG
jgi:hypothetical protein